MPTPPSTHTITRGGRKGGSAGNAATALVVLVSRPPVRPSDVLSPLFLFECSKTAAAVFWTRSLARAFSSFTAAGGVAPLQTLHARRAAPGRPPPPVWRMTVIVKRAHAHTRLPPSRTRTQRAPGAATTPLPPPPPPPPIWRRRARAGMRHRPCCVLQGGLRIKRLPSSRPVDRPTEGLAPLSRVRRLVFLCLKISTEEVHKWIAFGESNNSAVQAAYLRLPSARSAAFSDRGFRSFSISSRERGMHDMALISQSEWHSILNTFRAFVNSSEGPREQSNLRSARV